MLNPLTKKLFGSPAVSGTLLEYTCLITVNIIFYVIHVMILFFPDYICLAILFITWFILIFVKLFLRFNAICGLLRSVFTSRHHKM